MSYPSITPASWSQGIYDSYILHPDGTLVGTIHPPGLAFECVSKGVCEDISSDHILFLSSRNQKMFREAVHYGWRKVLMNIIHISCIFIVARRCVDTSCVKDGSLWLWMWISITAYSKTYISTLFKWVFILIPWPLGKECKWRCAGEVERSRRFSSWLPICLSSAISNMSWKQFLIITKIATTAFKTEESNLSWRTHRWMINRHVWVNVEGQDLAC